MRLRVGTDAGVTAPPRTGPPLRRPSTARGGLSTAPSVRARRSAARRPSRASCIAPRVRPRRADRRLLRGLRASSSRSCWSRARCASSCCRSSRERTRPGGSGARSAAWCARARGAAVPALVARGSRPRARSALLTGSGGGAARAAARAAAVARSRGGRAALRGARRQRARGARRLRHGGARLRARRACSGLALICSASTRTASSRSAGGMAVERRDRARACRARAAAARRPRAVGAAGAPGAWPRLRELAAGASLPLALQALYLICLRFATGEGEGAPTSFATRT